jgi:excisionase family DNA binding protein
MTERDARLLTIAEAATILRVRTSRAYDLARARMLPGVVRIGRQVRVDAAALDAWIAAGGEALDGGWRRLRR